MILSVIFLSLIYVMNITNSIPENKKLEEQSFKQIILSKQHHVNTCVPRVLGIFFLVLSFFTFSSFIYFFLSHLFLFYFSFLFCFFFIFLFYLHSFFTLFFISLICILAFLKKILIKYPSTIRKSWIRVSSEGSEP